MKSSKDQSPILTGFKKFRKEWIEPILIALILAGIIRTFIIQPFKIPSGSMEDTLLVGDQLMAIKFLHGIKIPFTNKRILKIRNPRPGDIIVFKYPEDPSKPFIKRCIATSGQKVEIRNKVVYVDGKEQHLPEHAKFIDSNIIPNITTIPQNFRNRDNLQEVIVPDNTFFAMGDNRDNSNDSRFWGFVPYENISGKAFILYWSWDEDGSFLRKVRWERLFQLIK